MAGHPILRKFIADVAAKAVELDLADPGEPVDQQAEAYFLHYIADGHTLRSIVEPFGVSRPMLSDWLRAKPERKELVRLARETSATALVEDGLDMLDQCTDARMASITASRANFRKWLASVRNRAEYGESKAPAVGLTFNSIHLQALQAPRSSDHQLSGTEVGQEKAPLRGLVEG
jgi:hypothetical protein